MARSPIQFLGLPKTIKDLMQMRQRLLDWEPIGDDIHKMLIHRQRELFKSRGQSEGVAWPDYSDEPVYAEIKQKLLERGKISALDLLRFKGSSSERLYPSLTKPKHPEHLWSIAKTDIRFGTKVPYAWHHDQGKGMSKFWEFYPERRIAVLSDRNTERLRQLIMIYVVRGKAPKAGKGGK